MDKLINYYFNVLNTPINNHTYLYTDITNETIKSYRRLPPNQHSIYTDIHNFIHGSAKQYQGALKFSELFNELTKTYKPINVLKVLADSNIIPSIELTKEICLGTDLEVIQYFASVNRLCFVNDDILNLRLDLLLKNINEQELKIFKILCRRYSIYDSPDSLKIRNMGESLKLQNIIDYKNLI